MRNVHRNLMSPHANTALIVCTDMSRFVLIVEPDFELTDVWTQALFAAGVGRRYYVYSGWDMMDYFLGKGRFANRKRFPLPDLLIIPARLPEMSGNDLLEWFQKNSD